MPLASSKDSLAAYRRNRRAELLVAGGLAAPFGRAAFARAERQAVAGVLSYPLEQWGRRLREVQVEAGAAVRAGEVLARGGGVELRASCAGKVIEVVPARRGAAGVYKG